MTIGFLSQVSLLPQVRIDTMKAYRKALTLSYDDGVTQDIRLVELLNRYGIKCTFNLNTGIQSEDSFWTMQDVTIRRMNQVEIGDLYRGHEIAVHGLTHENPTGHDAAWLEREYGTDIGNINRLYGEMPVGMAYAYGAYDDTVCDWLLEHGIKYGRTVWESASFDLPKDPIRLRPSCHHNSEALFPMLRRFLTETPPEGECWLFYVWGHSYEFDTCRNWARIEEFLERAAGRPDVFYGTNRECLEYFERI